MSESKMMIRVPLDWLFERILGEILKASDDPTFEASVAAATAVVDYDLLTNQTWASTGNHRAFKAAALLGSAAAGDTIVDLYVGTTKVGRLYNRTTGFPNKDDFVDVDAFVPAGERISAIVVDAPATNAINIYISIEDLT